MTDSDIILLRRNVRSVGTAILLLLLALVLSSCSPYTDKERDPLESFNRASYKFNEVLDKSVLRPVAKTYIYVVPEFGRQRVSNVLRNLRQPWIMVNSILQADAENAFSALWSFILNTTFGLGGLFDFAGYNTDLYVRDEDFGQTMAVWGFEEGAYIVIPFIGPSTVRDGIGTVADIFLDPANYANEDFVIARTIATIIDTRADIDNIMDDIYENSFDPYTTMRSMYLQRRKALVDNIHSVRRR